jgi:hypothetical protein
LVEGSEKIQRAAEKLNGGATKKSVTPKIEELGSYLGITGLKLFTKVVGLKRKGLI